VAARTNPPAVLDHGEHVEVGWAFLGRDPREPPVLRRVSHERRLACEQGDPADGSCSASPPSRPAPLYQDEESETVTCSLPSLATGDIRIERTAKAHDPRSTGRLSRAEE
jgi:hypothetical protein